jgi:two-component system phosphate regulon response regulator PhoB
MLYTLFGEILPHVAHLADALMLMTATRVEDSSPLSQSRVMVFTRTPSIDRLVLRLQRGGAFVKLMTDESQLLRTIKDWRPVLLIVSHWSADLAPWLRELVALPLCTELPVLAIGMDSEVYAMSALDAGASAYMAQPYSETLLAAQVGALLKHSRHWEALAVEKNPLICVQPESRRVWVNEVEIRLSRRLFRFLHYLALHPDRTFSSAEIANVLSDGHKMIQENSVTAQVHRLRKCLELSGAESWLETVHGFGYRLCLPQKIAFDVNLS